MSELHYFLIAALAFILILLGWVVRDELNPTQPMAPIPYLLVFSIVWAAVWPITIVIVVIGGTAALAYWLLQKLVRLVLKIYRTGSQHDY